MYELYKVTFSADGISDVVALLDELPPQVVSGYGGWAVVGRDRRIGLTQWNGKDPLRWAIPILFDGLTTRTSQELQISRLSRMALPPLQGGEPPVVSVSGSGLSSPGPSEWVIENLQWGTSKVIREFTDNGVMARMRQDCVVNLLQYVAPDRAQFKAIQPGTNNGKKVGWPKSYRTVKGDTLNTIAVKFYGDSTKWKLIGSANNIRDPQAVRPSTLLTIPQP